MKRNTKNISTFNKSMIAIAIGCLLLLTGVFLPNRFYANAEGNCGGAKTSIIKGNLCGSTGEETINNLLVEIINTLAAVVGILAIVMYIAVGVIYSSAGDSADRVSLAKTIARNTTIGLLLYMFLTVISNILIPGGIFTQ